MPAATTHVEFAKDVYQQLDESMQKKISNLPAFYLGAQGPDLFFFSGAGVLPHSLKKYGSMMHEEKPYEAIQFMHTYCENDPDLRSYYDGFLCHYALDSQAHPLIFYDAKYLGNPKESEIINHFRIEAMIDAHVLSQKERTVEGYDVYLAVKVKDSDTVKIASMYHALFQTVYQEEVDFLTIQKACKECAKYLKALKPTSTKKFRLLHHLENIFRQEHFISSLMLYNDFPNKEQILNHGHLPYSNIFDESIQYQTSFEDCYKNGIQKAIRMIQDPSNKDEYLQDFDGRPIKKDTN